MRLARRTLLLALPAGAARAEALDPRLAAAGWRFRGVPRRAATRFGLGPDGEITLHAENAVGFLARPFAPPPGALVWRWRVDAAPAPSDPGRKGEDDRPIALHVLFADAAPGPLAAMRRWVAGALLPDGFSGRAVTYLWGGAPTGTRLANPYAPRDGLLVCLRGPEAPLGRWVEERVDPAADFRAGFGSEAPPITHLALSADTDDRGGVAMARIHPPAGA